MPIFIFQHPQRSLVIMRYVRISFVNSHPTYTSNIPCDLIFIQHDTQTTVCEISSTYHFNSNISNTCQTRFTTSYYSPCYKPNDSLTMKYTLKTMRYLPIFLISVVVAQVYNALYNFFTFQDTFLTSL